MAAANGRRLIIRLDDEPIAGVRQKSMALGWEDIDVTNGEQNGYRHLLPVRSVVSLSVNVSGIARVENVNRLTHLHLTKLSAPLSIETPSGRIIGGRGIVTGFSVNGSHKDYTAFDATLIFTGEFGLAEIEYESEVDTRIRVVFLTSQEWVVPEGVSEIDVFSVGGGAGAAHYPASDDGVAGGGAGGYVTVELAKAVTPGHLFGVVVGAGGPGAGSLSVGLGGAPSYVDNLTVPEQFAFADGGASGEHDAQGGGPNGNSGGQSRTFEGPGTGPGVPLGTGFPGGAASDNGDTLDNSGGGGGGSGGPGTPGIDGTTAGNGGPGIKPAPGDWGDDIGEDGYFGGGGPSLTMFPGLDLWFVGEPGIGNRVQNSGGAGSPAVGTGSGEDYYGTPGFDGIVVIRYQPPT